MSIATKKGDNGDTSLYSGENISKSDVRVEAYGTGDELVSFIGFFKLSTAEFCTDLEKIQNYIYRINANLASLKEIDDIKIQYKDIEYLDRLLLSLENEFGVLKSFIIPSECESSARGDICRVVCRRFERRVVELSKIEYVETNIIKFINRLSDVFFMMARVIGKREGGIIHAFKR